MISGRGQSGQNRRIDFGVILVKVFMGVTLLIGFSAAAAGFSLLFGGNPAKRPGAVIAILMGLFITGISFIYLFRSFLFGPSASGGHTLQRASTGGAGARQKWLVREDWAARRIEHSSIGFAAGMWIWTIGWLGILSFIGWVNYAKILRALNESWWNIALLGVFAGAGLIGLLLSIWFTLSWLRYGTSLLHLDSLPAHPGERFRGTLEARLRPLPRYPLEVRLACEEVRWITTGSGKNKTSRLEAQQLGAITSEIAPVQISLSRTGVRCPVEIDVPSNLPEYDIDERGNGIRWVLTVTADPRDRSFTCSFEVPVFEKQGRLP